MKKKDVADIKKMHNNPRRGLSFIVLFILIILSYSNTLNSSWHLDDYHSIVNNRFLHINEASFKSFTDVITKGYVNITRPLANLTFAINWYFGKDDVSGYHIVNTGIHVINGFLLFITILFLFKTPNLKDKLSIENEYFIALLSAVLWAVNPIQTQAVTYIVQRMTSMAAMFYIAGIFFYIKGRLSDSAYKKTILYGCLFLSYIFAIGTKENTVIMPLSLILAEVIFFQDLGKPETLRRLFWTAAITASLVAAFGIIVFLGKDLFNIFRGYENRYFTPGERLLTEARIIVYYLSLVFYPVPTRLSIEHDIDISTSFFYPWTTMPSIIIILFLIGIGMLQARKRPLLSFAILFFFLNHVIESTIIGLELIFEHRNYLPSFFLFVPVSAGLKNLIDRYHNRNGMFIIISSFIVLLIIGYGSGTYIRNIQWGSEISLSLDAAKKAPESARSLSNLAKSYYMGTGQYDRAIELYHKALYLKTHNRYYKAFIVSNIAGVYYYFGDHIRAEKFLKKAVQIYPAHDFAKYMLALVSAKNKEWDNGLNYLESTNAKVKDRPEFLNLKGAMLFNRGNHEEALLCFRNCTVINKAEIKSRINIGAAYCLMGEYGKAGLFLKDAHNRKPGDVMTLLWLIETGLRSKDDNAVKKYIETLCSSMKINELAMLAEKISGGNFSEDGVLTPLLQKNISIVISEKVKMKFSGTNVPEIIQ